MAPSRTITTEITHARTGRSMKKRASMTVLLSAVCVRSWWLGDGQGLRQARRSVGVPGFRGRHVYHLRLHGDARAHLLQAVDDHPLVRPHTVGDLPQAVVERPQLDGAGHHLILLVHNVD